MEVDRGCGTITKVSYGDGRFSSMMIIMDSVVIGSNVHGIEFEFVSGPNGLSELRSKGTTDGLIIQGATAIMNGHLPSLAEVKIVGEALITELFESEASPH